MDCQGQLQAHKHAYRYLPSYRLHDHYSWAKSCAPTLPTFSKCDRPWARYNLLPITITVDGPSLGQIVMNLDVFLRASSFSVTPTSSRAANRNGKPHRVCSHDHDPATPRSFLSCKKERKYAVVELQQRDRSEIIMHLSIFTLSAFVATSLALPSVNHVLHEKRDRLPPGWQYDEKLSPSKVIPMKIALTQSNLDKADEFIMDVSHPESSNYGKHWTHEDIANKFAPSAETVDTVNAWLTSAGISSDRISRSQSLGWLKFDATVAEAEDLLKTEYHLYKHSTGKPHVSCSEYRIPEHVAPHVDFITPTVHFDAKIPQAVAQPIEKRAPDATSTSTAAVGRPVQTKAALGIGAPSSGSLPKKGATLSRQTVLDELRNELRNCNQYITPNCLRALYLFPPGVTANPKNSYGIVEYTPQAYLQADLDMFFANFSKNQVQRTPTLNSINGGVVQTEQQGFQFNGESDLDLEYAMTLINPQKTTLYQVGDLVQGASFNDFLDALDGSYCAGDDPLQDASYPDPRGGFPGPKNCGGFAATK
ncbi:MAG: hypothetical protein Q9169_007203, partial [Polycauliona sp. 2 TL-2023]